MAARPNMMKVAPLYHALSVTEWAEPILVHTGQHYDDNMSGAFLRDFGLPQPHHHLNIGSGTHAEQTGRTMMAYEALCMEHRPDLCVVVGDVNATIACGMAAKKLHIELAHLEAGLRSFDRDMPEEINRIATDAISDWYWTPSPDADENLAREGVDATRISQVGNIMIDSFVRMQPQIEADTTRADMGLTISAYAVVTFHRPANVDSPENLAHIEHVLMSMAQRLPLVFPVHPRTRALMAKSGILARLEACEDIHLCEPLPYIAFMNLVTSAKMVVTDSGGIQEETSYLGVPCLTVRENTERPITLSLGTNQLANWGNVLGKVDTLMTSPAPKRPRIEGWDGHTAGRIVAHIRRILCVRDATVLTKQIAGV